MSKRSLLLLVMILFSIARAAPADPEDRWHVKPYLGVSALSDTDERTVGLGGADGPAQVDLDTGFTAGLGVGYRFHPRFSAELAWEYRTNDSEVALADGQRFSDGYYASNIFYVNGYYHFESNSVWHPYIGAGSAGCRRSISTWREGILNSPSRMTGALPIS